MRFEFLTPRISKHYLLLVAAFVWTFAGMMLLWRGSDFLLAHPDYLAVKLAGCLVSGLLFFRLLFLKISGKHLTRMRSISIERPCLFSFFNWRSYLMMGIMIFSGIMLRKTGAVSPEYLSLIYITMGIPLLMSSSRFYYSFFKF